MPLSRLAADDPNNTPEHIAYCRKMATIMRPQPPHIRQLAYVYSPAADAKTPVRQPP
jgi:hypothetical protein